MPAILLVDDVQAFRLIVRDMLGELGYTNVIEASDGAEALEKARLHPVGLVISDYMMVPQTGLDLLRGLRDEDALKEVPFIMVSSISEMHIVDQAIRLGATTYLPRPVSFATLSKRLNEVFPL